MFDLALELDLDIEEDHGCQSFISAHDNHRCWYQSNVETTVRQRSFLDHGSIMLEYEPPARTPSTRYDVHDAATTAAACWSYWYDGEEYRFAFNAGVLI